MFLESTRIGLVFALSLFVSACSSLSAGNLFSHYSAQSEDVYQLVKAGEYPKAQQALPDTTAGDILDNMEKGRVTLLNQDYPESKRYLELSENAVREQQDQALISLTESASSIGALAANDSLMSYHPGDYELGFLHLYLALNYIKENDLEGALVEIRKANQVQEAAKRVREADLAQAEQEMKRDGLSSNLGAVLSQYPDAGKQLQAVQNGYLLFLSALLYETAGELNNAYVDYKRALAVMPANPEVIDGTYRLAKKLGMSEDFDQLQRQYGEREEPTENQGRIIILDEQGIVFARQGWKQALPVYTQGSWAYFSMSLPYYPAKAEQRFAKLRVNGQAVNASKLVDVNLMAQQDLTERIPSILIRQALRVVAKEQLRREAAKSDGVSNLLINVWNVLTEQPDTRSWQTLPAGVYSSTDIVEAGEYTLQYLEKSYRFSVSKGKTVFVWVSRQGTNATIWHKQLGSL